MESVVEVGTTAASYGVLAEPDSEFRSPQGPTMIFLNAGLTHRTGPRRIHVQIARRLADSGVPSLRLDLPGIGDSPARTDSVPARQGSREAIGAAMDYLHHERGTNSFVLFGICSGADYAFRMGLHDRRIVGLVLVNGYTYRTIGNFVRHYGRRLARPRNLLNPLRRLAALRSGGEGQYQPSLPDGFQLGFYARPPRKEADRDLQIMLDRGVKILAIHSHEEDYNYRGQFRRALPSARRSQEVKVEYLPYADHTFTLRSAQDHLIGCIDRWMSEVDWPPPVSENQRTPS